MAKRKRQKGSGCCHNGIPLAVLYINIVIANSIISHYCYYCYCHSLHHIACNLFIETNRSMCSDVMYYIYYCCSMDPNLWICEYEYLLLLAIMQSRVYICAGRCINVHVAEFRWSESECDELLFNIMTIIIMIITCAVCALCYRCEFYPNICLSKIVWWAVNFVPICEIIINAQIWNDVCVLMLNLARMCRFICPMPWSGLCTTRIYRHTCIWWIYPNLCSVQLFCSTF